jgi:nicotinamidase-related amidase
MVFEGLNKNTTPLVIVDMQWNFHASRNSRVVEGCKREIFLAKKRNATIVFLEYEGFGRTLPSLRKMVKDYAWAFFQKKNEQDGSNQVIDVFRDLGMKPKTIRVCGVNGDQCVKSTAHGLMYIGHKAKIGVVREAVNSPFLDYWNRIFRNVPQRKDIVLCRFSQKKNRYFKGR